MGKPLPPPIWKYSAQGGRLQKSTLFIALFEIRKCQMYCFNYLRTGPDENLSSFLIAHVLRSLLLVWNPLSRLSQFDMSSNITVPSNCDSCFLQASDRCLEKYKSLLSYWEVRELRLVFWLCVTNGPER